MENGGVIAAAIVLSDAAPASTWYVAALLCCCHRVPLCVWTCPLLDITPSMRVGEQRERGGREREGGEREESRERGRMGWWVVVPW